MERRNTMRNGCDYFLISKKFNTAYVCYLKFLNYVYEFLC